MTKHAPRSFASGAFVLLALLGSILCDVCMRGFHKIPFTCSYQPGKTKMHFALWGIVLMVPFTFVGSVYEWRYLERVKGQILIAGMLVVPALAMRWWAARGAKAEEAMQFEETEESEEKQEANAWAQASILRDGQGSAVFRQAITGALSGWAGEGGASREYNFLAPKPSLWAERGFGDSASGGQGV